jgi:hypothetical protein
MRVILPLLLGITAALPVAAQDAPQDTTKDAKPRIYIAAGAAWREENQGAGPRAEPEYHSVQIAADLNRSCGLAVVITAELRSADYVLEFSSHKTELPPTRLVLNRTDVNVYRRSADLVGASTKSSLGSAAKAACEVIKKDWPEAPHDAAPKRRDPHPAGRTAALEQ